MLTKTRPRAVTTSSSEAWSLGQSVKLTSRWAIKKQAVIVEVPTSMPILPMCRIGIYDGTSTITAYFQCGPAEPPQSHTCTSADTDPLPPGQTCQRTPALGTHGWGSPGPRSAPCSGGRCVWAQPHACSWSTAGQEVLHPTFRLAGEECHTPASLPLPSSRHTWHSTHNRTTEPQATVGLKAGPV